MPNHLAAQESCDQPVGSCDLDSDIDWLNVPDNLLLAIFSYLEPQSLLTAAQVNRQWHRVALDDLLWKQMLYSYWKINREIPRAPSKTSWLSEFRRLYLHTPLVETEVVREHRDQVLHVAFSHDGLMLASCSKDGFIKVWNSGPPLTLKYYADMRELTWKYTQFSAFNELDSHLLVSGVHFGNNSTSGEIVVFDLRGDKFELQCRVLNKPYDVFGSWYNNDYLLSGSIYWQGNNYSSCSVLWFNKASQALESEHESVVMRMLKFLNTNASSIRTILVANCLNDEEKSVLKVTTTPAYLDTPSTTLAYSETPVPSTSGATKQKTSVKKMQMFCEGEGRPIQLLEVDDLVTDEAQLFGQIEYGAEYRVARNIVDVDKAISRPSGLYPEDDQSEFECNVNCDFVYEETEEADAAAVEETSRQETSMKETSMQETSIHQSISDISLVSSYSCQSDSSDTVVSSSHVTTASSSSHVTTAGSSTGIYQSCLDNHLRDKYLIFTMGTKTYTPHQIGIKRIHSSKVDSLIEEMRYRKDNFTFSRQGNPLNSGTNAEREQQMAENPHPDNLDLVELANEPAVEVDIANEIVPDVLEAPEVAPGDEDKYDDVDHKVELHGHIIGMCLSPDHRYLYVNSRPWPKNYVIDDPLYPPPIAQEIDIHVIDLLNMEQVGMMHRAHKAYTPNDECFFIFLDVCEEYVASGAENKQGYLWDRHYGVCLARYPHTDVVNCVAFNPCDSEMLVTASDDHSIKIWRSRHKTKQYAKCKQKAQTT